MDQLVAGSRDADVSPETVERIRLYGTMRMLRQAVSALDTPQAMADPTRQQDLRNALTYLNNI